VTQGYHTEDEERHMKAWFDAKMYQFEKVEDLKKQLSIWQNRLSEHNNQCTESVGQDQEIKSLKEEVSIWKHMASDEKKQRLASEEQLHTELEGCKKTLRAYWGIKVEGGHDQFMEKVQRLEDALHLEGTLHETSTLHLKPDHEREILDLKIMLQAEQEKSVAAWDRENVLTREYQKVLKEMVETCKTAHENEITRLERELEKEKGGNNQVTEWRRSQQILETQIKGLRHAFEKSRSENKQLVSDHQEKLLRIQKKHAAKIEEYKKELQATYDEIEEALGDIEKLEETLPRSESPDENSEGEEELALNDIDVRCLNTPE
jgi:hypothetical protein